MTSPSRGRRIAADGYERDKHKLTPEECLEVCDFVLGECKKTLHPPDLRLLDHACQPYLQDKMDLSKCPWHDMVTNRISQSDIHFRHDVCFRSREERLEQDRRLVRTIMQETANPKEQVAKWIKDTGKSQATFYSRKRELESGEFPE